MKDVISKKAKENQSHGQTAPGKTLCQNSDKAIEKIDTKKELAKIADVSRRGWAGRGDPCGWAVVDSLFAFR